MEKNPKNVKKPANNESLEPVDISPERRVELINIMERAANRPSDWFDLTLNADIQSFYWAHKPANTKTEAIPRFEPVDKLNESMCEAVTEIFRSSDDELKRWCQLVVICSLKGFLLSNISRYTSRSDERESFIQSCLTMICEELPKYDYYKGNVTMSTYFGGRLHKILGEERRKHDKAHSSRYFFTLNKKITDAIAGLREINEDPELDPSPDQIAAWLQNKGEDISTTSVMHCLEQTKNVSTLDETVATQISPATERISNPEEVAITNETINKVVKWLGQQSPLVRSIMSFHLGTVMDSNKAPTQSELVEHVKREFPNVKDTNILRYKNAAFSALREVLSPHDETRTRISTKQIAFNGLDPTKGVLKESADQVVSAVMSTSLDEIFD